MATRSTIALEFADGSVAQVYCHWDGYLSNNGKILFENYADPFKVAGLIKLGDISSLGPGLGDKHDFNDAASYPDTTFYGRDRGETGTEARWFKDYADYRKNAQGEEYNYILRTDGNWYVEFYGEFDGLLSEALEREAAQEAE